MSEAIQDQTTQWLRSAPNIRGMLVRAIWFADETLLTDGNVQDFASSGLEAAWRIVADSFQVLRAQHLPPTRLTWVYERMVLHFAQRADSAILGVIVTKKAGEVDIAGLERLLTDFQSKVSPPV